MIIEQTCNLLLNRYGKQSEGLTIKDVAVGSFLTAVRLSDDGVGTAATLREDRPSCGKKDRDFGDFTPLRIKGQKVSNILLTKKESGMISSLKTAVINAVSSKIIMTGKYRIIEDCDPLQLADLDPGKKITIVGAFKSYISKISSTGNRLSVLELNEEALEDEHKKYFVKADRYARVISESDTVIITGQTLVNRTIDDLLSVVSPGTQVIVTGPSAGILPEVLFGNKVSIIGSIKITDSEKLFDVVSQGGTGFHLFEYCARKICILNGDGTQVK